MSVSVIFAVLAVVYRGEPAGMNVTITYFYISQSRSRYQDTLELFQLWLVCGTTSRSVWLVIVSLYGLSHLNIDLRLTRHLITDILHPSLSDDAPSWQWKDKSAWLQI